jgi:preprotein translocase subunit SecG
MFAFLLTLLILDALLLSVVVLLQAGQGGGLASLGGATTDTVLGGRQAVTQLTKAPWWCGGIFLVLALALSLVPRAGSDTSDLQQRLRAATPTAPAPSTSLPIGGAPATPGAATPAAPGAAPAPSGKAVPEPKPSTGAPATGASPSGTAPTRAPAAPSQPKK